MSEMHAGDTCAKRRKKEFLNDRDIAKSVCSCSYDTCSTCRALRLDDEDANGNSTASHQHSIQSDGKGLPASAVRLWWPAIIELVDIFHKLAILNFHTRDKITGKLVPSDFISCVFCTHLPSLIIAGSGFDDGAGCALELYFDID